MAITKAGGPGLPGITQVYSFNIDRKQPGVRHFSRFSRSGLPNRSTQP